MAEVVGVVASGISIGSLVIQLFESVQKLHRFWKLVDSAPKGIGNLIEELQILGSVFNELMTAPGNNQILSSQSIQLCLQYCRRVLDELEPIVFRLHNDLSGSKHRKQWASLKSALWKEDIRDITERLERSKTMLIIAINSNQV